MATTTEKAEHLMNKTASTVEDTARRAAQTAEETADNLARRGREVSDNVSDVANEIGSALEQSVRKNPLTTLAMGVAAGFVIGALWKS